MAKKGVRIKIGLVCSVCNKQNYVTEKNKVNRPTQLQLRKYCNKCRRHTVHKEKKKLH